jgi:hypothetical protein
MTKRSGWTESLRVLNLSRRSQEIESWTSALTLPLLYFFRRRVANEATARADPQAILKGLHLVPMNQAILDHSPRQGPTLKTTFNSPVLNRSLQIISSHETKKTLIPRRSRCLHRRSGSPYRKSPHLKPSSRDLQYRKIISMFLSPCLIGSPCPPVLAHLAESLRRSARGF